MTASAKLARVLRATAAKVSEERRILEEYRGQLEMVGPAPGQPHHQHEAMVSGGAVNRGHLSLIIIAFGKNLLPSLALSPSILSP